MMTAPLSFDNNKNLSIRSYLGYCLLPSWTKNYFLYCNSLIILQKTQLSKRTN